MTISGHSGHGFLAALLLSGLNTCSDISTPPSTVYYPFLHNLLLKGASAIADAPLAVQRFLTYQSTYFKTPPNFSVSRAMVIRCTVGVPSSNHIARESRYRSFNRTVFAIFEVSNTTEDFHHFITTTLVAWILNSLHIAAFSSMYSPSEDPTS